MMQSTQFRCLNRIKNDPINTRNASGVIPKDLGGVMYEIIYDIRCTTCAVDYDV